MFLCFQFVFLSSYLCYPLYPPHFKIFLWRFLNDSPQHTTPLQASLLLLLPLQKFSSYHSLHFPFVFIRVPFVFTRVPFVFTCVHSCSIRVHSCLFVFRSCSLVFTRVHSCSIRVHSCSLVFTRVPFVFHSCSIRVHSCSFVFHSCSLVFIRVHSCSFVFRSVWCFRYDRMATAINCRMSLYCTSSQTENAFNVYKSNNKMPLPRDKNVDLIKFCHVVRHYLNVWDITISTWDKSLWCEVTSLIYLTLIDGYLCHITFITHKNDVIPIV